MMKIKKMSAAERVILARSSKRPGAEEYIANIIDEYTPLAGDRCYGDDPSVTGGVGFFHDVPVTVIGQIKGHGFDENVKHRFGMPDPEGYRKATRLMKQAAKFRRPVITFIDTPGAYPGKEAEERGQGQAIAECIKTMSRLPVPTISVFTGEGGSGGALAFAVSDRLIMMENSIFSILSPEGFASILWHDAERWQEACEYMKLTSADLFKMKICDEIIPEPSFEEEGSFQYIFDAADETVWRNLEPLLKISGDELIKKRYLKLRKTGSKYGRN